MQWFRSYVGTHSDPKIATVARKVGLHRTIVLSVWLAIEECACAAINRGSMADMDFDDVATALDIEAEQVQAVVIAFKAKGMIAEDGTLTAWQKRQFQSDSDPTNAQRQKRYRDKAQSNAPVTDAVTEPKRDVTTRTDTDTDQNRSEEKQKGARAPRFEIPDWVPIDPWRAFEEMRQKNRKPMTDRARELTVRDLEKLRGEGNDPGAVLLQSVKNSWRGVFPLKDKGSQGPPETSKPDPALALKHKVETWRKFNKPLASYEITAAVKAGLMTEDEARAA